MYIYIHTYIYIYAYIYIHIHIYIHICRWDASSPDFSIFFVHFFFAGETLLGASVLRPQYCRCSGLKPCY